MRTEFQPLTQADMDGSEPAELQAVLLPGRTKAGQETAGRKLEFTASARHDPHYVQPPGETTS